MWLSVLRLALLTLAFAAAAGAQPEAVGVPATDEAQTEPGWIRPEEVPKRAEDLLRQIDAARPDPAIRSALEEVEARLAEGAPKLSATLKRVRRALAGSPGLTILQDLQRELAVFEGVTARFEEQLDREASRIALGLEKLETEERRWAETATHPETAEAGDAVSARVARSRDSAAAAIVALQGWRKRVFDVSDQLVDRSARVAKAQQAIGGALAATQASLLVADAPPIWRSGFVASVRDELPQIPAAASEFRTGTSDYILRDARPFLLQGLVAIVLALLFRAMSVRARRLAGAEASLGAMARVLERPFSIGLLLALFATPIAHPAAPTRIATLILALAMVPAARIVLRVWDQPHLPIFAGAVFLLLLERVTSALEGLASLQRATLLLSLVLGLGLSLWLARGGQTNLRLRSAMRFVAVAISIGLLAEVGGWSQLATLVGRALMSGALLGLYLYAGLVALDAVTAYALRSRLLARLHLVKRHRETLGRQIARLLRFAAAAYWLYGVLGVLGARSAAADWLGALLSAGVSVGALSLSIGGVLAFLLTLMASLWTGRIVSTVFEEDVFPRAQLPRGIPYALSALTRYAVYSLGFLLALAAAGVELGQLTIMLGGLGVGIGLGLQDLVKNFAAGLTLLFERRVHVGDAVQVPSVGVFGRVIAIGMRATMVRSWDGAELVVPNSDLVSGAVTNWTLSDRLRRIEVPVGVAYGTDPDRVVTLLLEVAAANENLLEAPPPQALFKGFGESSLDFLLRAWTDIDYDRTLGLTSEVALGVHRALYDARVTIPFPQRDLHLASVSPEARAAFTRPAE
jgi:potassium efflux system protein